MTTKFSNAELWAMARGDEPYVFDDEDESNEIQHVVPFMNLTKDERDKKSTQFKFGLCSNCDAGLDDKSEFVCEPRPNGAFVMTCNACYDHHQQLVCNRGCGGCN